MYSEIENPERWVLPLVLKEQAALHGCRDWVSDSDGDSMTFAQAEVRALRAGQFLRHHGTVAKDRVGIFMYNSCDFVSAWLGLGYINATAVLFNSELRGAFLSHQINDAGIRCIVIEDSLMPVLEEIWELIPLLKTVVVRSGGSADAKLDLTTLPDTWDVVHWGEHEEMVPVEPIVPAASDIACVMYTSGTTGPSKGVLMPHAHCTAYGIGTIECVSLKEDDRYYICLPLFHVNGLMMQLGATLLAGIPVFVRSRFSASEWLNDVIERQTTVTNFIGSTTAFTIAQPETPRDNQHNVRAIIAAPTPPSQEEVLRTRFAIPDVLSAYGMTEVNIPVWGRLGSVDPGAAGWTHTKRFEVQIVNPETDLPVPAGVSGEIVVRPKVAFAFMAGYLNRPDATAEACRNLWFHTGDAGVMDGSGRLTFLDRIKDTIRRRGENIAAAEIEGVVSTIEGVSDVAAYAVKSDIEGAEDEVMLSIVVEPGMELDATSVAAEAASLLPRFARPRYIRFVDTLPKTATGKTQRAVLRRQGITQETHDLAPRRS